jgi:hypothetical protein
MKASKLKAAKLRLKVKEARAAEVRKLEAKAASLKSQTLGLARTPRKKVVTDAFEASKMPQYAKQRAIQHTRPVEDRFTMAEPKPSRQLTGEMLARELAAKEIYETKMKPRIGPAFNKSGDMYLSESELDAEKKGELRRRS